MLKNLIYLSNFILITDAETQNDKMLGKWNSLISSGSNSLHHVLSFVQMIKPLVFILKPQWNFVTKLSQMLIRMICNWCPWWGLGRSHLEAVSFSKKGKNPNPFAIRYRNDTLPIFLGCNLRRLGKPKNIFDFFMDKSMKQKHHI